MTTVQIELPDQAAQWATEHPEEAAAAVSEQAALAAWTNERRASWRQDIRAHLEQPWTPDDEAQREAAHDRIRKLSGQETAE